MVNVGRQGDVDCWSSNRERASSKLGTDSSGAPAERIGLAGVATVSMSCWQPMTARIGKEHKTKKGISQKHQYPKMVIAGNN